MSKYIQKVDISQGSPQIVVGGISAKKNVCGGVFGIVYILIFLFLIIFKLVNMFNYSNIYVNSFVERDQSLTIVDGNNIALLITSTLQHSYVNSYNKYQYGVQVLIFDIYLWVDENGQPHNDVLPYQMIPCDQDPDLFCPPKQLKINLVGSMENFNPYDSKQVRYYDVVIRKCKVDVDSGCRSQIFPGLNAVLGLINQKFNVFQTNTDYIFSSRVNDFGNGALLLNEDYRYIWEILFTKLIIDTDRSLMPSGLSFFQNNEQIYSWFYPNQNYFLNDPSSYATKRFLTYRLKRSFFTQIYKRSFLKIDIVLASIFSVMGVLSSFIILCCRGYNKWLMEKYIIKNIEEIQEKQPKIRKLSITKYYQELFKKIYRKITSKQQMPQQVKLDLMNLFKQIKQLRKQVKQLNENKMKDIIPKIPRLSQQPKQNNQSKNKLNESIQQLQQIREKLIKNSNNDD